MGDGFQKLAGVVVTALCSKSEKNAKTPRNEKALPAISIHYCQLQLRGLLRGESQKA
jgi:hypothetical protein